MVSSSRKLSSSRKVSRGRCQTPFLRGLAHLVLREVSRKGGPDGLATQDAGSVGDLLRDGSVLSAPTVDASVGRDDGSPRRRTGASGPAERDRAVRLLVRVQPPASARSSTEGKLASVHAASPHEHLEEARRSHEVAWTVLGAQVLRGGRPR